MAENVGTRQSMPTIGMALWLVGAEMMADRVRWCGQNGFESVALSELFLETHDADRERAAYAIDERGLEITWHPNLKAHVQAGQVDQAFLDRVLDDVLWWHEHAGTVRACCFDPVYTTPSETERWFDFDLNAAILNRTAGRLAPAGIAVGIENNFGPNGFKTPEDLQRLASACEHEICLLLDLGHLNIHCRQDLAGADPGRFVHDCPLRIVEVHVSDNHGRVDEHLPLGSGTIDFSSVSAALKAKGFDGLLTVETAVDSATGRWAFDTTDAQQVAIPLACRNEIRATWG